MIAPAPFVQQSFHCPAWFVAGIAAPVPGWLSLNDGWLTMSDQQGVVLFRCDIDTIDELVSPWYFLGQGLRIRVGKQHHYVTFGGPIAGQWLHESLGMKWRAVPDNQRAVARYLGKCIDDVESSAEVTTVWRELLADLRVEI
ncbi:MAG: hypothetical protein R3E01_31585 [Pirellulaceae bacterium]|nr:hypothetical protein [Planctomycetales bacterium]